MATKADALDQRAAAQLDVEIIPGTEVMRDVDDVHFAHAGGSESGSVLVPHPTNNPNGTCVLSILDGNPYSHLNRSTQLESSLEVWHCYLAAVIRLASLHPLQHLTKTVANCIQLFCRVLVCSALSIAPMFPLLGAQFHLNPQQLSLLTGVNVITLGFANILIVPLSNIFGRRPISIIFGFLVVLTNIWQALATSHKSFLAARACNGLVAATSETIMVQVIADMSVVLKSLGQRAILIYLTRFFLHERGFWMGAYFTFYFSGAFLGPIMSGNIAARHGWRSFFWLSVALSAFVTILLVFFFPETKWQRYSVNHAGGKAGQSETPSHKERTIDSEASSEEAAGGKEVGKGKPSKTQYMPVQKLDSAWWKYVVRDITTPVIVFFNPIVFWVSHGCSNVTLKTLANRISV